MTTELSSSSSSLSISEPPNTNKIILDFYIFLKEFIAFLFFQYKQNFCDNLGDSIDFDKKCSLYIGFFVNHTILFEYCFYVQSMIDQTKVNGNENGNEKPIGRNVMTVDTDANIFPIQTFQEYVDANYNLRTLGSYDYTHFLNSMREPVFKKNFSSQYQREMKKRQLKNEIMDMSNTKPLFINLVAFYDYKLWTQSNCDGIYMNKNEKQLKKIKEYERITFEQIELTIHP